MSNLIKNEINKVLRKKGIYIMLIIIIAYVVLSNFLYKYFYNKTSISDEYSEKNISILKDEMQSLDTNLSSDLEIYVSDKTTIDTYELLKKI